jgi:aldose 1-epimerase
MRIAIPILFAVFFSSCILSNHKEEKQMDSTYVDQAFSDTLDGKVVGVYVLKNNKGMEAQITNYGATLVKLTVPDKQGIPADVVLGYDNLEGYYKGGSYFGCVVGRYANRIGKAKFNLGGKDYMLAANNGPNTLHGGLKGFDKVVWDAKQEGNSVTMTYTSKDGEEGYPGNLTVSVKYTLDSSKNRLQIDYLAETDKETVLNITNHSYFNLEGQGAGEILDHEIMINASAITPVDSTLIPTGKIQKLAGTAFDFSKPTKIGARINDSTDQQILYGLGYDHNFVLNGAEGEMKLAAKVTAPRSGRVMEVYTTQPGVQFYTGNFLDGKEQGKGSSYKHRTGFCLETQHFPDSPNQPSFPSTVLKPGEKFQSSTYFEFPAL